MARKLRPYSSPFNPEWGRLVRTRTRLVTGPRIGDPVHTLKVARIWERDGQQTVTFYSVNVGGRRPKMNSEEKVYHGNRG